MPPFLWGHHPSQKAQVFPASLSTAVLPVFGLFSLRDLSFSAKGTQDHPAVILQLTALLFSPDPRGLTGTDTNFVSPAQGLRFRHCLGMAAEKPTND